MDEVSAYSPQLASTRTLGICAFLLGCLVGLVMLLGAFKAQSFTQDGFDPYHFGAIGESLANGNGFDGFGSVLSRKAPLYPSVIGGIYFAFGEHPTLVLLLQSVLLGGTCWLIFDMGRRLANLRTGVIASILYAVHPLSVRYVADFHLETLLTFLFALTVWCTIRFNSKPTVRNGVFVGLAGAAAALTKPVVLIYPLLFVAVWLVLLFLSRKRSSETRPPFVALAAIVIAMAVAIAPWTVRNYYATDGHFVLITTGLSDAFLRGYVFTEPEYALLQEPPYEGAENTVNDWFRALAVSAGTTWEKDDYETEQILNKEAKRKLTAEPLEFVRKFSTGLFTFWYQMTSLGNSVITGLAAAVAWAFALIGLRRGWAEGRPLWLLVLPIVQLNLILAVLLALGRYSAPVIPMLLLLAAFGIDTVLARLGALRSRIEFSRA